MLHAVADHTRGTATVSRIARVIRYIELSRLSDADLSKYGLARDAITRAVARGHCVDLVLHSEEFRHGKRD
jgi:hypothetical protein